LVKKPERNKPLKIPRHRCKDNINMDSLEENLSGSGWRPMAGSCEHGNEPRGLYKMLGIYSVAEQLLTS
jgi:hypothetical protein